MYASQSNTTRGLLRKTASAAITGGYLVKLATDGRVSPVAAASDKAMFLALHDAASGEQVDLAPLSPEGNVRIRAGTVSGTQNAGVAVYLAAAPAADGRINEVSTSATKIGYAEEQFVTNQLVLIRLISPN
jgi:hypothetical protein